MSDTTEPGITTIMYEHRGTLTFERALVIQWITALESGEYQQGAGYMGTKGDERNPDTYCCLGVVCNIAAPDEWFDHGNGRYGFQLNDEYKDTMPTQYEESEIELPDDLAARIGLGPNGERRDGVAFWDKLNGKKNLAEANDTGTLSFTDIAASLR